MDPRLERLLGGETLAALRKRLRQRYERGVPAEVLRLGALSEAEHTALAALCGRPARSVRSMQIKVAEIDAALARVGLASSLRDALEQLDGPIIDTTAQRLQVRVQWQQLVEGCAHPALAAVLQTSVGLGLLKRLCASQPESGERLLLDANQVLRRLPAAGIARAQLAVATLGDAHALDSGKAVATLVLSALRHGAAPDDDADRARDLWAAAGVLVNELARPALALNLPGPTGTAAGEPTYFSLRSLVRSPPVWAVTGRPVFVCENPNLLAIAADQLGPRCAPLVCTDGMPAAAQRVLLTQLRAAGARLHYHGDFDWPGLRIGNQVIREHGARPWRFSSTDYRAAVISAPRPGRTLDEAAVSALWDDTLADAMLAARLAIDEEGLADVLLDDLGH